MLSQDDANALLLMPKRMTEGPATLDFPVGTDKRLDLVGVPHPEEAFVLDLWRGKRNAVKVKFQTRGRNVIILARLDLNGAPHTNPDGEVIPGTHLHTYREGYGDRWATPLDPAAFADPLDLVSCFEEFCKLCVIENPPYMNVGLV